MKKGRTGSYYSGTSGLVLPVPNKSYYPPEYQDKSRLTYYSSLFNSIEINSSFYKLPRSLTMQKWAASVAAEFHFTFKMWKAITHTPQLAFDEEAVKLFMSGIDIPKEKKGCLLIQFPKSLRFPALPQLHKLIQVVKSQDREAIWMLDFEFRDTSWYREETFRLLQDEQCGMVFHDKTGSATPMDSFATNHIYLRFHGPRGNYRGGYEEDFLHEYAGYIKEWLQEGKDVYVYFNNTMGDAVQNLMLLNKFVKQNKAG